MLDVNDLTAIKYIRLFTLAFNPTDYRKKLVSKKVRVGTVQYFELIKRFTTKKNSNGITSIPVTVSQ
jgi:hypothetical protein